MALAVHKEMFTGKYNGVTSPVLLKTGDIADGKNIRKISEAGGWKVRKGVGVHNSTAIASAPIRSLHVYQHPRNDDYHFLAQCNGNLYDATNDPPNSGTTFGSSISTDVDGTTPGFSDTIEEHWLYADGNKPLIWGGDNPYVSGFFVEGSDWKTDFTRYVTDQSDDTYATVPADHTNGAFYFCCPQIASELKLDLGSVNSNSATLTISAWRSNSWTGVSGGSDGTASGGATLAQDGTYSWTAGSDEMRVLNGIMGYWYKVTWSADLSGAITIISAQTKFAVAQLTNKWNGIFEMPAGVRFFDQSAGEYVDYLGKLTNQSTSQYIDVGEATTSDYLYIKGIEPLAGIAMAVVDEYENTASAVFDLVEYWDGDGWTSIAAARLIDETSNSGGTISLAQSGTLWWDTLISDAQRREMDFDSIPGYWYRVSWGAAFSADVRIFYIAVAYTPKDLDSYDGVIEFKGRAMLWGDSKYPNRLRFSSYARPDCFSGSDSGYTDPFGSQEKIIVTKKFYNELLVWKKVGVWLLEGYSPQTFGTLQVSSTVGCVAPKTAHVVEVGYAGIHRDELMSIAIWMDSDGVYVLDGRKPKKVSLPVNQYFNTEYATAISASDLANCEAFIDKLNNEYHLLIPDGTELVYNYVLDEWYPPWERTVGGGSNYLSCGLLLRGSDNRYYTYGGSDVGKVYRLETDTTDKDASNADVAISHSLKTRAISLDQKMTTTFEFVFRKLWIEAKARTSPATKTVVTKFYRNLATSGITLSSPGTLDLGNAGYELVLDGLVANQNRCGAFQLEFSVSTADLELELYSLLYAIEALGSVDL